MLTQVVRLVEVEPKDLQKLYLRLTKELYILTNLQHERVVQLHACAATRDEITLVMEVSLAA
jgi:hypothetical protein